jgi:hypothetical protein
MAQEPRVGIAIRITRGARPLPDDACLVRVGPGTNVWLKRADIVRYDPAQHAGLAAAAVKCSSLAAQLAEDNHLPTCVVCAGTGHLLLCDACINCVHMHCLAPPLKALPSWELRCHVCTGSPAPTFSANAIAEQVRLVLAAIAAADDKGMFAAPVAVQYFSATYAVRVEHPMDLQTMQAKARAHCYGSVAQVAADTNRMLDNCAAFNKGEGDGLVEYAEAVREKAMAAVANAKRALADAGAATEVSDVLLRVTPSGTVSPNLPRPLLSPAVPQMRYRTPIRVCIDHCSAVAEVFYTVDGSTPQPDGRVGRQHPTKKYTAPFMVSATTTVSVVAVKQLAAEVEGAQPVVLQSPVVVAVYQFDSGPLPDPTAAPVDVSAPPQKRIAAARPAAATVKRWRDDDLWPVFVRRVGEAELPGAEQRVYAAVASAKSVAGAIRMGVHVADARRVLDDFALFKAINVDLINAPQT